MQPFTPTPKGSVSHVALSWLPRARDWLAYLIIYFSSTQLGLHFWPNSTLVYGIRVDYLSPTLYALDLLIIFYLFILFAKIRFKSYLEFSASNLGFLPILLINLIYSVNPISTLNWMTHAILYYIFVRSIPPSALKKIPRVIALSIILQVTLAASQVWLGRSIGGPLYYLGERTLSAGQPSVALTEVWGHITIRGYGTFGHPNVLAGYLVISTLIILLITRSRGKKDPAQYPNQGLTFVVGVAITATIVGLILTESRAASLAFFGLILPLYYFVTKKARLIYLSILLLSMFILHSYLPLSRLDTSILERRTLQTVSLSVIAAYPLFGAGAQASITTYPTVNFGLRLLQPDHNSLSLLLSWFGVFGILAFIYYFKNYFKFGAWNLGFIVSLLPLIILDHYLLTSPQGLFIFLLFLKVVNYSHAQKRL